MILNVSGRCDIVAFYTKWFMNRYKEGYVDVRNPFYPKMVSRIYFDDVDAIVFCTKNPIPIVNELSKIDKPIIFQVTITPYKKDIEPNVPDKKKIIEALKKISNIIGNEYVYVRYDPIFINDKYTVDYHIKAFDKLCSELDGYISHIIISFMDDYKNVRKNEDFIKAKILTDDYYRKIGINFSSSAKMHNITVQTCCEDKNLVEYGFIKRDCIDFNLAFHLTGKTKFTKWKERNCSCVELVDIGYYNSCSHFCKYCYANFDEASVKNNVIKHNPNSSLLIGKLDSNDTIKIRKK